MDITIIGLEVHGEVHEIHALPDNRDAVGVVPTAIEMTGGRRHHDGDRGDRRTARQIVELILADEPNRHFVVDGEFTFAAEHLGRIGFEVAGIGEDDPVAGLTHCVGGTTEHHAVERPEPHLGSVGGVVAHDRWSHAEARFEHEVEFDTPHAVAIRVSDRMGR